jgi:hypothetical protein
VYKGSCLCGSVSFQVSGTIPSPDACHCSKCRKFSGHYFVSADVPKKNISITGEDKITWFQSSEKVRRGFCSACGSSLFFDAIFRDWMGIAMGAFDGSTDTHIEKHIFTADKGDYYEITDGLPQERFPPK